MSRGRISIDLGRVEELAAQGLSLKEIAASLGIARSTFYQKAEENSDILDTIRRGRASLVAECIGIILNAARSGERDCWKAALVLLEKYSGVFVGEVEETNTFGLDLPFH